VLTGALLLTFSRASFAGLALVGALFLMWRFNAKTLSLTLIALTAATLLLGDLLYARLTTGFDQDADAVSAGRISIWLPLLPEVAKSPVWGQGLSSILWSFPMVNEGMPRVGHPHNAYLEALLDIGLVGLALTLAFYAHVWKGLSALVRDDSLTPDMRALFRGATAALAAYLLTCLAGSSLRPVEEAGFVWVAIGLMYGMRSRRPAR
jgi:O-antigen ligase